MSNKKTLESKIEPSSLKQDVDYGTIEKKDYFLEVRIYPENSFQIPPGYLSDGCGIAAEKIPKKPSIAISKIKQRLGLIKTFNLKIDKHLTLKNKISDITAKNIELEFLTKKCQICNKPAKYEIKFLKPCSFMSLFE